MGDINDYYILYNPSELIITTKCNYDKIYLTYIFSLTKLIMIIIITMKLITIFNNLIIILILL